MRKISLKRAILVSDLEDLWEFPGIQNRKAQRNVAIKALTIYNKEHISKGEKSTKTWRHES